MRFGLTVCLFALAASAGNAIANSDESIFVDGFESEPAFLDQANQRFSLMWLSGGTLHRAAIRGDASIRDTDSPSLIVFHTRVGHYCIKLANVSEGVVGVLQDQGGTHGVMDVTMGIGNPCPNVSSAQISVRTMQIP
ncbi:MAG: hypothetical protein ABI082_14210 [Dokdonella sp.]